MNSPNANNMLFVYNHVLRHVYKIRKKSHSSLNNPNSTVNFVSSTPSEKEKGHGYGRETFCEE